MSKMSELSQMLDEMIACGEGMIASKSAAGYKKEVKELLEKYGAQQLKQVNPDDYAAILKEAEVIGNA